MLTGVAASGRSAGLRPSRDDKVSNGKLLATPSRPRLPALSGFFSSSCGGTDRAPRVWRYFVTRLRCRSPAGIDLRGHAVELGAWPQRSRARLRIVISYRTVSCTCAYGTPEQLVQVE